MSYELTVTQVKMRKREKRPRVSLLYAIFVARLWSTKSPSTHTDGRTQTPKQYATYAERLLKALATFITTYFFTKM